MNDNDIPNKVSSQMTSLFTIFTCTQVLGKRYIWTLTASIFLTVHKTIEGLPKKGFNV